MTVLLPERDGLADHVAQRVLWAAVVRYGDIVAAAPGDAVLDDITFYCLPYMGDDASRELVARLPALTVIQSLSSGVDDIAGLVPPGVTLCNGRGLHHEESTAELAVTLVLATLRRIPLFTSQQARAEWRHVRGESLDGKRVVLVGYGAIGRAIEQRLLPFGAQVGLVSRTARSGVAPLTELTRRAEDADVLIACLPLTDGTRGIIGADVLRALPDGALVVNVSRGPVVDAVALRRELATGRLRAALDVTDPEPLPPESAEWSLPNVIVTPHVGGDTTTFVARAGDFLAEQVTRHLNGHGLRNVVRQPA